MRELGTTAYRPRAAMRIATLTALGVALAAAPLACLGFSTPANDTSDDDVVLPDRSAVTDASVVDRGAPLVLPTATPDAATDAPVDAAKKPLRAFVSSATRSGNLGGIAGADQTCNTLATAAGIGGTYRAWISVSGTDALDRITSAGPWKLVTGEVVADDKAGLASGSLKHLVDKDETGKTPPEAEDRVWTATGANGRFNGPDCTGWTSEGPDGIVGEARNGDTGKWTALGDEGCGQVNRVYCFEL